MVLFRSRSLVVSVIAGSLAGLSLSLYCALAKLPRPLCLARSLQTTEFPGL